MRKLLIVALLPLLLGGCESLYAVGGGVLATGATAAGSAFKEKLDARMKWRVERATFITDAETLMRTEAQTLFKAGNTEEALAMYQRLLNFHDENYPEFLAVKLGKYIAAKRREKAAPLLEEVSAKVEEPPIVLTPPKPIGQ